MKFPVTWGQKKKRYVFTFISNFSYFGRDGNVTALFPAAHRELRSEPGSHWQSPGAASRLSDEAGFQVPTRSVLQWLGFVLLSGRQLSHVPQLICNPLQMFSFFFFKRYCFRYQLWGIRMGLLKVSFRSWWKSWGCVRQLLYSQFTIEFNSQHCFPRQTHVHSVCQHWLKNMPLTKMWGLNVQALSLLDSSRHFFFFFPPHGIWFLLTSTVKKILNGLNELQGCNDRDPCLNFVMKSSVLVKNTPYHTLIKHNVLL